MRMLMRRGGRSDLAGKKDGEWMWITGVGVKGVRLGLVCAWSSLLSLPLHLSPLHMHMHLHTCFLP